MSVVVERVKPLVEETLRGLGYELVDIEYKKLYGQMHLIVYIDNDKGIGLDDCERVNNALDAPLEALDPTGGQAYALDISSPGLDRPFKTQRDFERNYNREVEVRLYAPIQKGIKSYEGILICRNEQELIINTDKGEVTIPNEKIAQVRPLITI